MNTITLLLVLILVTSPGWSKLADGMLSTVWTLVKLAFWLALTGGIVWLVARYWEGILTVLGLAAACIITQCVFVGPRLLHDWFSRNPKRSLAAEISDKIHRTYYQ